MEETCKCNTVIEIDKKIVALESIHKKFKTTKSENLLNIKLFVDELEEDENIKKVIILYLKKKLSRSYGLNYLFAAIIAFFIGATNQILDLRDFFNKSNDIKIFLSFIVLSLFIGTVYKLFKIINVEEQRFYDTLLSYIENN